MSTAPTDPLSWWQQMMHQAAPLSGLALPTLDIAEIDRRIREYQAVEGWLQMNLASIQMMRQTLEMQRAALNTWNQFQGQLQEATAPSPPAAESPAAKSSPTLSSTPGAIPANPFEWMQTWWQTAHQAVQSGATAASAANPATASAASAAKQADRVEPETTPRKRTARQRGTGDKPKRPS